NLPPSFVSLAADRPEVFESELVALTGSFTDVSPLDNHIVSVAWGDGTTDAINLLVGDRSFVAMHRYRDNRSADAPYAIHVTLTDGYAEVAADASVVIHNLPPTISSFATSSLQP